MDVVPVQLKQWLDILILMCLIFVQRLVTIVTKTEPSSASILFMMYEYTSYLAGTSTGVRAVVTGVCTVLQGHMTNCVW